MNMNIDLSQIPADQLEAALVAQKELERKRHEAARRTYESRRDSAVEKLVKKASSLMDELKLFKESCVKVMNDMHAQLSEYGDISSTSKGGFQVLHSDGKMKVVRRRDTLPTWDERAEKGVGLIKEFLYDTVKKKDKDLFEILISFIERNQNGDLEYAKVLSLIKHRDKYTDERWVKGLSLIEESYKCVLKAFNYEFKIKSDDGGWENVDLNFVRL